MTTPTLIGVSPPHIPELDLETRLVLINVEMDGRLERASVAFEVNTAHLPGADSVPDITEVVPLTPTAAPAPAVCPYDTPLAALLHRARVHIETHGWLRGGLREDDGTARCPIGAIRIEAASRWQADDACVLLLDVIQQDLPFDTIPQFNDSQTSPAPVLHYLDRAAQLAHHRSL